MKKLEFKQIIKEAVFEVLRDQLPVLINEVNKGTYNPYSSSLPVNEYQSPTYVPKKKYKYRNTY